MGLVELLKPTKAKLVFFILLILPVVSISIPILIPFGFIILIFISVLFKIFYPIDSLLFYLISLLISLTVSYTLGCMIGEKYKAHEDKKIAYVLIGLNVLLVVFYFVLSSMIIPL